MSPPALRRAGFMSKKVKTSPSGWRLPESITRKLVELLYAMFDLMERVTNKLKVGEINIGCLAQDGGEASADRVEDSLSVSPELITSIGSELENSEDWEELRVASLG